MFAVAVNAILVFANMLAVVVVEDELVAAAVAAEVVLSVVEVV